MKKEKAPKPVRESRLEDDPDVQQIRRAHPFCRHPGHKPPAFISIPFAKRYRHICPKCGFELLIRNPTRRLAAEYEENLRGVELLLNGELADNSIPQVTRDQLTEARNRIAAALAVLANTDSRPEV